MTIYFLHSHMEDLPVDRIIGITSTIPIEIVFAAGVHTDRLK